MTTTLLRLVPVVIALAPTTAATAIQEAVPLDDEAALRGLNAEIEDLRVRLEIPSLSAGVVRDGELIWAKGFGMADPARGIPATADTPYHLASLTKTFASAVLLQLLAEEMIDLDDPIADYGVRMPSNGVIRVRHLYSHTSQDPPGAAYRYDGNRFGGLEAVIEEATGTPFEQVLRELVLDPLELESTVPGNRALKHPEVFAALARPYAYDDEHAMVEGMYPTFFGPSAGLISTVPEVAKFATAFQRGQLVPTEFVELAFTPATSTAGETLPYGLGWFTQKFRGIRTVWHYGFWQCNSSFILVLPDLELTFIALCNTDGLSRPFSLGGADGDALDSPMALAFMKAFALPDLCPDGTTTIDWSAPAPKVIERIRAVEDPDLKGLIERELRGRRRAATYAGDTTEASRMADIGQGIQ